MLLPGNAMPVEKEASARVLLWGSLCAGEAALRGVGLGEVGCMALPLSPFSSLNRLLVTQKKDHWF